MPCMYFTKVVFGRSGSGLRNHKYSANCLSTPIKKLYRKDTVYQKKFDDIRALGCTATDRL